MLFPNSGGYCSEQALFSCGENSLMEPAANRRPAAVAQKRFPTSPGLAKEPIVHFSVLLCFVSKCDFDLSQVPLE